MKVAQQVKNQNLQIYRFYVCVQMSLDTNIMLPLGLKDDIQYFFFDDIFKFLNFIMYLSSFMVVFVKIDVEH